MTANEEDRFKLKIREELIYKMRNDGMIYRLIAQHFGITIQRIRQIYKKKERKINNEKYRKNYD